VDRKEKLAQLSQVPPVWRLSGNLMARRCPFKPPKMPGLSFAVRERGAGDGTSVPGTIPDILSSSWSHDENETAGVHALCCTKDNRAG
jgi:hypothetical protein